ncbi:MULTISPECIES: hypothetical protein [Sphingomonas]|uniref:Uncharacterized protein n=1 Tax=Sphingomonas trueperi TaxID=53317 RepID=A0A7X5XZC0_9SPHN|nr:MULTISPECIES: hypothetical protein [Sphingomonas]NJB97735.1 hypothetical protein [Sphingomonas trueperi]
MTPWLGAVPVLWFVLTMPRHPLDQPGWFGAAIGGTMLFTWLLVRLTRVLNRRNSSQQGTEK